MKKILVTGGAGYIGSHTCVELLDSGYQVLVLDNLSNSKKMVLDRIEEISNQSIKFFPHDLLDTELLASVFANNKIDAVIHFAGSKSVSESVSDPLSYYQNNVGGAMSLLKAMGDFGVKKLIFSSSATVYGDAREMPINETAPLQAMNPYGQTKIVIEKMLEDIHRADPEWNIVSLRYFNPGGAHASGKIGEDPRGIPNNLLPYVSQVASGKLKQLTIFGKDYKTSDGTCIRDYVHVVDLALGHIAALDKIDQSAGCATYNLGTGNGSSVLELVNAFQEANEMDIPFVYGPRRPGDIDASYADVERANRELGWYAKRNINDICRDAWSWQLANPEGYL
jgi:UDP-glucose 4-epimerase